MHRKTSKRFGNIAVAPKYTLDNVESSRPGPMQTLSSQDQIAISQPNTEATIQSAAVSPSVSLCLLRAAATDTLDVACAINDESMATMADQVISFCEARLRG